MKEQFLDGIQLKDSIRFNGSVHDLKECIRFKKKKKFEIEWKSNDEFVILSKFSVGTAVYETGGWSNNFSNGIKGFGKLISLGNGTTEIHLTTKLRIELIYTLLVFGTIFIADFATDIGVPMYVYLLLPVTLVWFWIVFRFQERRLFRRFKNYVTNDLKNALQHRV